MRYFDYTKNTICVIKSYDLIKALSTAYRNGHDATVESNYIDPFEVGDTSIDLADDMVKEGILEQLDIK